MKVDWPPSIQGVFALKEINKQSVFKENMVAHVLTELHILRTLGSSHPFIIGLHRQFQTKNTLNFIMEYVPGGTLLSHLTVWDGPFPEEMVQFYGSEILLAIEALHEANVIHRDLKLENIMLDVDGHIRLIDFGLSHQLKPPLFRVTSFSGSKVSLSPEVFASNNESQGHGFSVDWWAFGVVLYQMATQELPFWADDLKEFIKIVLDGPAVQFPEIVQLSLELRELIAGLLDRNIPTRLGCTVVSGVILSQPEQVKGHPFFRGIVWDDMASKTKRPPIIPKDVTKGTETGMLQVDIYRCPSLSKAEADTFQEFENVQATPSFHITVSKPQIFSAALLVTYTEYTFTLFASAICKSPISVRRRYSQVLDLYNEIVAQAAPSLVYFHPIVAFFHHWPHKRIEKSI